MNSFYLHFVPKIINNGRKGGLKSTQFANKVFFLCIEKDLVCEPSALSMDPVALKMINVNHTNKKTQDNWQYKYKPKNGSIQINFSIYIFNDINNVWYPWVELILARYISIHNRHNAIFWIMDQLPSLFLYLRKLVH